MSTTRLGILGGGQLGRMSAQSAKKSGFYTVILTPEVSAPASEIADKTLNAEYDDELALNAFAGQVDVVTYEFENIPVKTIEYIKKLKPVYPDSSLLDITQDRIKEKSFLNELGISTARWAAVDKAVDISDCFEKWNSSEAIIKTTRFGYDGKGQMKLKRDSDLTEPFRIFAGQNLILEDMVDFSCEISVIVARDKFGHMECYGPTMNEHKNHILDRTIYPAAIPNTLKDEAISLTKKIAEHVNLVGVLALEMFVTKDGKILSNEIAPRTHNSGHWSMDGCKVSQFDNHIRAVCGLPVLPPEPLYETVMINLIGDDVHDLTPFTSDPQARIHLYGKTEARPGRKMGHVNILGKPLYFS